MIKNLLDLEKNEKRENKGIYINTKKEYKDSKKNLSKSKERLLQYPQVINNYDVNVKVNIKKLNDNKINIENMNIGELISRKIESNNKKSKNKNNLLDKNEKKEFFNQTDNNINFLNFVNYSKDNKSNYIINNIDNNLSNINKNRNDIQNGEHYNNIISNLKNEFKQITKGNEIINDNICNKEKKYEKIKNYLLDIKTNNTNNTNNKNKKESYNNTLNNILNNNKENKNKKFTWNLKSMNNNIKKDNIIRDNYYINSFKEKIITNENKMKTQNNFYKIPKKYVKINNDISNLRLTEKNEEHLKLKSDKINQSLNKNNILINNKRKENNLNLTDYNLKLNNINDNNNMINIKKDDYKYNYLNLTYSNNNNNNINKDNSLINIVKDDNNDNNIIEEYISTNNHNKKDIYKRNNFINNNSSINKTQSFIKQGKDKEKNNIIILRNNQSSIKLQNHSINNKQPKLLYLDKRINKIKRKLINEIKKEENNSNCNGNDIYNMTIENNISFSYMKKINNNKKNDNCICSKGLNLIKKILNVQSNIIFELKQKLFIINKEIIKKNKEILNLKNICLKLMWFIKSDNINKENNKRKIQIQNQIIKENMLLRKLYINKTINHNIINKKDINIINNNIKQINEINEEGIFNNVMKSLKEKKNNNYGHKDNQERLITFENNERFSLKEKDYFNDKKRNKSYERRNEKNKKEKINNKNNETDIIKNNTNSFYYNNYVIKLNKYNEDNNDNNNIKIGKKIKYITK